MLEKILYIYAFDSENFLSSLNQNQNQNQAKTVSKPRHFALVHAYLRSEIMKYY